MNATRIVALLALTLTATARGTAQPLPYGLQIDEEWYRSTVGDTVGNIVGGGDLLVADLDGSGAMKVVTTAEAGGLYYWYVLAYEGGEYRQEWVSDPSPEGITALRVADLDGVPGDEVVLTQGNDIHVFHGSTPRLVRTIDTGHPASIRGLQIADADGDGDLDFVFCSYPGLFVYEASTGAYGYQEKDLRCDTVAVGNVDNDPNLEIVLGARQSSLPGYVLDGTTRELEWTRDFGFGDYIRTGDLDGDGRDEILAASLGSDRLTIYDVDQRSQTWEITFDAGGVGDVQILDVDGDGPPEIVFGTRFFGEVHVWDPRARELLWSPRPGFDDGTVKALAVGDPDGDGTNELVWGVSGSRLRVVSTATHMLEWQADEVSGPFLGVDFGDVDFDGAPEILYGSSFGNYRGDGSHVFVHDIRTKALEHDLRTSSDHLRQIRHADADEDPQAEIFTLTDDSSRIVTYDGLTLDQEWSWRTIVERDLSSLEVADLEGDGDVEVIVGACVHLFVLDAATGEEKWQAVTPDTDITRLVLLRIADVDEDPSLEIVALRASGRLVVFDALTHEQELLTEDLDARSMTTVDRNGDGVAEILIGTSTGTVAVVDATSGEIVETLGGYGGSIDGLDTADLTGDLVQDLVLAQEREVLVVDGLFSDEVLWRSGPIGDDVGRLDNLRVADIDEDGKTEILVSLGRLGVKVYEVEGAADAPPVPAGPYLESPELPGFLFKVRITSEDLTIAGYQEANCIGETLCVSGALEGRSELFLRVIGPRPNGYLWVNLVRFTPARVEVWVEQTASGTVNYYELPALPPTDTELAGLVDKRAFSALATGAAGAPLRRRPLGAPGVSSSVPDRLATVAPAVTSRPATFTSPAFPGYEFSVRILADGVEQPVRIESDCPAETLCVSGALAGRSELFIRLIGPRPNGFLWANLVRFTTSRVEVEIERLTSGKSKTYVLEQVPSESDQLPGWLDRQAFLP